MLVNMIKTIASSNVKDKLNQDSFERVSLCLRILASFKANEEKNLFSRSQEVFSKLLATKKTNQEKEAHRNGAGSVAVDEPLQFGLLRQGPSDRAPDSIFDRELKAIQGDDETLALSSKLDQVFQLTGTSLRKRSMLPCLSASDSMILLYSCRIFGPTFCRGLY